MKDETKFNLSLSLGAMVCLTLLSIAKCGLPARETAYMVLAIAGIVPAAHGITLAGWKRTEKEQERVRGDTARIAAEVTRQLEAKEQSE